MNWRFTIIDRNNVSQVINEPVGWDAMTINLDRDEDKHGIVIDFQENNFDINGKGYKLVRDEYEAYGIEGDMTFVIEFGCDDVFEEVHRGKLNFTQCSKEVGYECFMSVSIEAMSDIMTVINRIDQSVNLLADKAFDGTTVLPAYDKLGFDLLLPSKGILLQNKAENEAEIVVPVLGATNECGLQSVTNQLFFRENGLVEIPFAKTIAAEIGGFYVPGATDAIYTAVTTTCEPTNTEAVVVPVGGQGNLIWPDGVSPTVNYAEGMPGFGQIQETTPILIEFKLKGSIVVGDSRIEGVQALFYRRTADDRYEYLWTSLINDFNYPKIPPFTITFDSTVSQTIFFNKGDRLYFNLVVNHRKSWTQEKNGLNAYTLKFDATNYFKMTCLSHTAPTYTKAFMVNEVISRVVESISNGKVRAYSDYFGRTDAMPYTSTVDGCGSLEAIAKGIFIRRQENRKGATAVMAVSLKDTWEGLNPIHHLGYGFEPDIQRPGFNRLRVENWKFFYEDTVILRCIGVNTIKLKVVEKEHYSTFSFGYQKWEAEEYNGLDEFLTKRNYRTTLSQVKNELTQLSKWVGSGYAWEITRRKGDQDSKDWRYDNDIFITCLERSNTITYVSSFSGNVLGLWRIYTIPAWAVVGSTITIGAYETDELSNAPIPGNSGTFTITAVAVVPNIGIRIELSSNFPVFRLFAGANVSSNLISGFMVELGNVINPQNIIDAPTVYNWRIRPASNAMRWMDKVLSSYRQFDNGKSIIFMDGEGNYFAKGEMESVVCKLENTSIAENDAITPAQFIDPTDAKPSLRPERIEFEYKISLKDFKAIKANPKGLIYFENESISGEGWIDKISYRPEEGKASFNLIPKYQ